MAASSARASAHASEKGSINLWKLAMVMMLLASGFTTTEGALPSPLEHQIPHKWCDAHTLATLVVRNCFGQPEEATVSQACCSAIFMSMGQHDCFCKMQVDTFFHLSPLSDGGAMSSILQKCNADSNLYRVVNGCPAYSSSSPDYSSYRSASASPPSAEIHHSAPAISPISSTLSSSPSPAIVPDCINVSKGTPRAQCVGLFVTAVVGWLCAAVCLAVILGLTIHYRRARTQWFHMQEMCVIPPRVLDANLQDGDRAEEKDNQSDDEQRGEKALGQLPAELFGNGQSGIELLRGVEAELSLFDAISSTSEPTGTGTAFGKGKRPKQENVRYKEYVMK